MEKYYVNKRPQPNNDHEVHTLKCHVLPNEENRIFLGVFDNCHEAVELAKKTYPTADGCVHCAKECHHH